MNSNEAQSTMDVFIGIVSIISLPIGIVSLILSIYFFKVSLKLNKETDNILNNINSTVARLEALYKESYTKLFETFVRTHDKLSDAALQDDGKRKKISSKGESKSSK